MTKRDYSFNLKHIINYGLKNDDRANRYDHIIISILCTFCITFV